MAENKCYSRARERLWCLRPILASSQSTPTRAPLATVDATLVVAPLDVPCTPHRLLGLPETLRLTTLPRNITSPLAMAISSMLGADTSLAIAIVVITGLIGANFGATVLDALG